MKLTDNQIAALIKRSSEIVKKAYPNAATGALPITAVVLAFLMTQANSD